MRVLPQKARNYLAGLWSLALLLVIFALLTLYHQHTGESLLIQLLSASIFAVTLTIADLTAFHLDESRTVSIAVALLITALTVVQWPFLLLVVVMGTLSALLARETPLWQIVSIIAVRWLSVSFAVGVAELTQSVQLALGISQDLPYTTLSSLIGLLLMGAGIYFIERGADAGLLAFREGIPLRAGWRGRWDDLRWYTFMLAPLGGLLAILWSINGFAFLLGIVPTVIVQRAFRSQAELSQRSSEVQDLAADYSALNSKLERLQSLAITLIATRDVQTMLETLCSRLAALFGASSGWVVLLNDGQMPQMVAWHNLPIEPDHPGPHPVPSPQSYDQVLSSQRVLLFAEDQRTITLAPLSILSEDWFWKALIVIPLVIDEPSTANSHALGAICLTFEEVRGLNQNEQRILSAFARQAALSLENARLLVRVQESQAELIQSSKLAAVGTFAAGIAHEFNNLLAGMLGYAQLGLTVETVTEKNDSLKVVVDACKRGKSITTSLLTFARRQEPRRELGDVRGAIEDTLTLMEIELRKCNIAVERYIMPVPYTVCDLGQISQVFLNLLTNARDAMKPDGGMLTVELDSTDDFIVLCVRDTGCGIPESIRDKIFEPFVTTKGALGGTRTPGTGLGLSVSYGIIQDHGGTIAIDSTPGAGTTVTVRLPIVEADHPEELADEHENGHVPPLRILVVDDDPTIGDVLPRLLEPTGHTIVVAHDGATALRRYREGHFDLVLTDLTMPGMSGVELVHNLRALDPDVTVLACTGQAFEDQVNRAIEAGAVSVLHKPFEVDDVLQAIRKAWKKRNRVQESAGAL